MTGDHPLLVTSKDKPLIVDLDGTLIRTDLLYESLLLLVREKLYFLFLLPYWLFRGKAHLKRMLTRCTTISVQTLPYHQELLVWLKQQRDHGRYLVLCSASDSLNVQLVAQHLGIFDEVIASDGLVNLAGAHKAAELVRTFGAKGFDYVGNSSDDLHVWAQAHAGIVVNASERVLKKAQQIIPIVQIFQSPQIELNDCLRVLRAHQWVKNILLFIPLLAAHVLITLELTQHMLLAFLSFSLCASAVYITNDLLDLESDRQHPRKYKRPFASGKIPIWNGLVLAPILLLSSITIGVLVSQEFTVCLLIYFGLTCAYSFFLKRVALLDCMVLAILYTLRIVAGAIAAEVPLSFWLLSFSVFLFLSLAFIKRYAELYSSEKIDGEKINGRGYMTSDQSLIQQMGVSSGFAASLLLALYLNSENVARLYHKPEIIWASIPLILLWLSRMWLKAHRGLMHDDPILFAIKDKASLLIGVLFVGVFYLATLL